MTIRETSDFQGAAPGLEASDSVAQAIARMHLRQSQYADVRRVKCHVRDGILRLQGRVSSFFHKQLAFAAVQGVPAVNTIYNEVEVL